MFKHEAIIGIIVPIDNKIIFEEISPALGIQHSKIEQQSWLIST